MDFSTVGGELCTETAGGYGRRKIVRAAGGGASCAPHGVGGTPDEAGSAGGAVCGDGEGRAGGTADPGRRTGAGGSAGFARLVAAGGDGGTFGPGGAAGCAAV